MAELTASEIVPRVIVRERLPATPVAGSREAVAKSISEKLEQGAWREGLKLVRQAPIESNTISKRLEQIGRY